MTTSIDEVAIAASVSADNDVNVIDNYHGILINQIPNTVTLRLNCFECIFRNV